VISFIKVIYNYLKGKYRILRAQIKNFILIVISKSNLLANLLNFILPTAIANAIIKYPRLTEEDHEESGKESQTLSAEIFSSKIIQDYS